MHISLDSLSNKAAESVFSLGVPSPHSLMNLMGCSFLCSHQYAAAKVLVPKSIAAHTLFCSDIAGNANVFCEYFLGFDGVAGGV